MANYSSQGGVATPADVAAALVNINLDHLAKVADAGLTTVTDDSIIAQILAANGVVATYDDTIDCLRVTGRTISALNYLNRVSSGGFANCMNDSLIAQMVAIDGIVANYDDNLMSSEAIRFLLDTIDGKIDTMVALMPASKIKAASDFNMHANYLTDDNIHSNDGEVTELGAPYVKHKEIVCPLTGTLRIYFGIKSENVAGTVYGLIYKNGIAQGTPRSNGTTTYVYWSEDLDYAYGDLIQLYIHGNGTWKCFAQNFRVRGVLVSDFVTTM